VTVFYARKKKSSKYGLLGWLTGGEGEMESHDKSRIKPKAEQGIIGNALEGNWVEVVAWMRGYLWAGGFIPDVIERVLQIMVDQDYRTDSIEVVTRRLQSSYSQAQSDGPQDVSDFLGAYEKKKSGKKYQGIHVGVSDVSMAQSLAAMVDEYNSGNPHAMQMMALKISEGSMTFHDIEMAGLGAVGLEVLRDAVSRLVL